MDPIGSSVPRYVRATKFGGDPRGCDEHELVTILCGSASQQIWYMIIRHLHSDGGRAARWLLRPSAPAHE